MEMTTVSPSPASPTEGDNLCDIDVTNVAIHSVTLLICLCGLVGNGAVLCLLSLKLRNTGIFDLACADFLFLLFTVPSAILFLIEDMSCSPIMPLLYLRCLFQLPVVFYFWVMFRLMFSSNNCNMYKLCMFCCRCNLPKRLLWLVFSVQYWALIALVAVIPTVTNTWPSLEQGSSLLITFYALFLLFFAPPVVISIIINFIKAKRGSKEQQPKGRQVVLFLMVVFVLLLILRNFLQDLRYTVVSVEIIFLLNCIYSSTKPFIYFLAGRCWSPCSLGSLQLSLKRVFDKEKEKIAQSSDALMDIEV